VRRVVAEARVSAPKILFLATEDWFVRSHFMPLVRRAQADGFDVAVAARVSSGIDGVRVIDMPFARGSMAALGGEAKALRALMQAERPDIVHAIALKPIALSLLAGAQGAARAFALTGRGYFAVTPSPLMWTASEALRLRLRFALMGRRTALLVENKADRAWVEAGDRVPDARVTLMPGAGVDVDAFQAMPEPPAPVIIGVVARLVWSKGIDLAVEAVRRLNADGLDVRLHIAGASDADNPEGVHEDELARWRATPGVSLLGRVEDVNAFWAGVHVACLPSRGGEGLPRSLLEAAAGGRPIVTSDAPGCGDFVSSGEAGVVVARESVNALTQALRTLACDAAMRARMGAAARAQVVAGYTERHAADAASAAWKRLLDA
jgi:glycosyltransferase involved in cell wall biosynthesis